MPEDIDNKTDPLLQYYKYKHLPTKFQETDKLMAATAAELVRTLPRCAERTAALHLLLQAKDCAVRAMLPPEFTTVQDLAEKSRDTMIVDEIHTLVKDKAHDGELLVDTVERLIKLPHE
jgi:hypothetical protein